jgi:hypothetical protein
MFNIESTPKSQLGRHCEGEARSNLLVIRAKGLLHFVRNDVFLLFGVDSMFKV